MCRLGSSKGRSRAQFSTFDRSARAGRNYVKVAPTWITFEDGESLKDIDIKIIPSTKFTGTLEFGVYINEDNPEGASVGKYLHVRGKLEKIYTVLVKNDLKGFLFTLTDGDD